MRANNRSIARAAVASCAMGGAIGLVAACNGLTGLDGLNVDYCFEADACVSELDQVSVDVGSDSTADARDAGHDAGHADTAADAGRPDASDATTADAERMDASGDAESDAGSDATMEAALADAASDGSAGDGGADATTADSAPEAPPACVAPQQACGTTCMDTTSDPLNCGRCAHNCQGGDCMMGLCQPFTVVNVADNLGGVAVDSTNVYWLAYTDAGVVMKMSLDGGGPQQQVATIAGGPQTYYIGPLVDDTSIYWVDPDDTGAVMKVSIDGGGGPTTLASGLVSPADQTGFGSFIIDKGHLYWSVFVTGGAFMNITKAALDGGSPTTFVMGDGQPTWMSVDDVNIYWAVTMPDGGWVAKAPLDGDGGPITKLVTGVHNSLGLAVDQNYVYYTNTGIKEVLRVPIDGGMPETIASAQTGADSVVLDATGIYWGDYGGNSIMMVPPSGGPPVTLAKNEAQPGGLVLDATSVYWVNSVTGAIRKVAKP